MSLAVGFVDRELSGLAKIVKAPEHCDMIPLS